MRSSHRHTSDLFFTAEQFYCICSGSQLRFTLETLKSFKNTDVHVPFQNCHRLRMWVCGHACMHMCVGVWILRRTISVLLLNIVLNVSAAASRQKRLLLKLLTVKTDRSATTASNEGLSRCSQNNAMRSVQNRVLYHIYYNN